MAKQEVKIATIRAIKSWEGLRLHVPKDVIEAAKLRPGDFVGLYVDPARPAEFVVRKIG
jgi:hypothetical protein